MSEPHVVDEWDRNTHEVFRVSLTEFGGRAVVDCRTWYRSSEGLRPTRAGVTMAVVQLPRLSSALVAAEQHARLHGLLPSVHKAG